MIRFACVVGVVLGLVGAYSVSYRPSAGGFAPLLQSHYDAELARVRLEARIAQAEIDALPASPQ
jgi:hypothetical protein